MKTGFFYCLTQFKQALYILCGLLVPFFAFASEFKNNEVIGQPTLWQFYTQNPESPMMEAICGMHDMLLVVIFSVAVFVTLLLIYVIYRYQASRNPIPSTRTHNLPLEIIWTVLPVVIVLIIMIPSVKLMYKLEKAVDPAMTIKITGKQWYWTYDYPSKTDKTLSFDSHIIEPKDLKPGQLRLLDVDNRMVVPVDTTVQLIITAADVLHSFAVPSLGIKKDAVPGRINETWFKIRKEGVYYGQCSELCGEKHGYMPISIHAVSMDEYKAWHKQQLKNQ